MMAQKDKDLAHQLRDFITKMNKRLRKKIGSIGLSINEQYLLGILHTYGEQTPSELCIHLNISSQFASQLLNQLEAQKFVKRKPSKTDKRKILVMLSKKGLDKIENSRLEREEWLSDQIATHYNNSEKECIQKALLLLQILPTK